MQPVQSDLLYSSQMIHPDKVSTAHDSHRLVLHVHVTCPCHMMVTCHMTVTCPCHMMVTCHMTLTCPCHMMVTCHMTVTCPCHMMVTCHMTLTCPCHMMVTCHMKITCSQHAMCFSWLCPPLQLPFPLRVPPTWGTCWGPPSQWDLHVEEVPPDQWEGLATPQHMITLVCSHGDMEKAASPDLS